ncbi:kinase-like domain-containing protein [Rhizophagus irregularis DAOM 181602=DAOM 197198]|uniref:Kinase-like domain-containing protein n=1 Tax=Rhizophagus irregularis (strain DAOM 181602 / DAOM 197198 / MUCL 43194) TaxID=747089 RepID=A0A2P4P046_RHIID|nr:kinase-like domain-containing protein [Rhizophagus irregularis DAOM 181602=DAOM 197198]POG58752.1 kinase-like domain-containing protein [Rhizophagus irregularis DAOM 181602=DAOM 197198]|eukprot:XP_025165618.1 kinase-like domain-containing protein [Rhizophagus irregularis DAOM 181602=DAOM 197198]
MELVKLNDENSFDPTPKLKSSSVPIFFVSFDKDDENCIHCGEKYMKTLLSNQKYCKTCLSSYLTNITDNNIYLDYLFTKDLKCNEHEISRIKVLQSIQNRCRNCLIILCFKQIPGYYSYPYDVYCKNVIKGEKYCKLCGKLLSRYCSIILKLCSNCYLISSGRIESTLTKKLISIIYLPFWENRTHCYCSKKLVFTSNCQKYCGDCFVFVIGCRYCLITNIIFGYTNQSQCKKCKRVSTIIFDITNIISGYSDLYDFLSNVRYESEIAKFANDVKNIDKYFVPFEICEKLSINRSQMLKYIPYSQFTNVKRIAKGGYGIVYQATWLNRTKNVILKRFKSNKCFLDELKSNYHCCYEIYYGLIETYGYTKDPKLDDYILVMQYASEGDLHKYLQKEFTKINWGKKITILVYISRGLFAIHDENFIHRDLHSGNILVNNDSSYIEYAVGDLGLSRHANDILSNNEIYGVIPYIAPEIFKGSTFSKESDIYSLGMIMWKLTTGCKPFANVEHDHRLIYNIIDGVRPEITEDTPKHYANVMKRYWDSDPKKRPSAREIFDFCNDWSYKLSYSEAELKKKELINSKKLGPKFSEKPHPKAIYTSRPISSYISKCSSIFTKCSSINSSNDYTSIEVVLDVDIESKSKLLGTKRKIEELLNNSYENNGNNGKYFI